MAALRDEHVRRWAATPAVLPDLGPPAGWLRHRSNERAARRLVDTLAREAERLPDGQRERQAWRESARESLEAFGETRLAWPAGYRRLAFADDFFAASKAFAREARAFAPELRPEDLRQALRNVWIGNSLQMRLGVPIGVGPGLFAYSMLYPLTDNLLDDPAQDGRAKRAFSARFGRRLAGEAVPPDGEREAAVFELVRRIEGEFPRDAFPDVHESLLAIHRGQVRSLGQQDDPGLSDGDVLEISLEKGGSSVLADLYLVAGRPGASDERFAFGYGAFLQLLDDLQDVETDLAAGHQTLFTRAAGQGRLDVVTARLGRFVDRVLDADPRDALEAADWRDLVRRNCRMLLVGGVAEQAGRFSRRFRLQVERHWPFALGAMCRLRRRVERRLRDAGARHGGPADGPSLVDLVLETA
ncbi:MAG TPA: class 1 isoprenoid biosynthesis enzyme [Vicinamibacteria bacterium]